jgi:hypothetical protein
MSIEFFRFVPSPAENSSPVGSNDERRELRRAFLLTLVFIVVGLAATLVLPAPAAIMEPGLQSEPATAPLFP